MGMDRCVRREQWEEGEEEGLENNSLPSAGVLGKEQVRRYPLHCFCSFYLTPVRGGEVKRRDRSRGRTRWEASKLAFQNIRKAQKAENLYLAEDWARAALSTPLLKLSQFRLYLTQISACI